MRASNLRPGLYVNGRRVRAVSITERRVLVRFDGLPNPMHYAWDDEVPVGFFIYMNVPGFLPDAAPVWCESFDEAKRYLIGELLHMADDPDTSPALAEVLTHTAEDVNLWSCPQHVEVDGVVYGIA